jgi:hypothetical protein
MNDTALSESVKRQLGHVHESLSAAHLDIPAGEIVARGDRQRAHRRRALMTAAAVTVGSGTLATALLVQAGLGTGTKPRLDSPAQLAAWTVVRQANGNVRMTYRDRAGPAGLQRELRADGLRVSVGPPANSACRPYPATARTMDRIISRPPRPARPRADQVILVIHPAAIPAGAGLVITLGRSGKPRKLGAHDGKPTPRAKFLPPISLVHASKACTG